MRIIIIFYVFIYIYIWLPLSPKKVMIMMYHHLRMALRFYLLGTYYRRKKSMVMCLTKKTGCFYHPTQGTSADIPWNKWSNPLKLLGSKPGNLAKCMANALETSSYLRPTNPWTFTGNPKENRMAGWRNSKNAEKGSFGKPKCLVLSFRVTCINVYFYVY